MPNTDHKFDMRRTYHHQRSAFTLVELLVVMGIIAVLVSILVPAVSMVHQEFQSARCLSNLKQIGVAISGYAMDHDNCLVPGDYFGYVDGSPTPGGGSWEDILIDGGYIPAPSGKLSSIPQKQAEFAADTSRDNILQCPSGLDDTDGADYGWPSSQTDGIGAMFTLRPSDISLTSVKSWYACNTSVYQGIIGRPLPFKFLPDINPNTFMYDWTLNKVSSFHNTSRLPLIFDGYWMFLYDNPTEINARHNNRTQTNILFADYHAETQKTTTLPNNDWYLK